MGQLPRLAPLLLAGCASAPGSAGRVVDLTHPLDARMPLWPGGQPLELTPSAAIDRDGCYMNIFKLGEHTGTHIDAPAHFVSGQITVERIAPERFVGPAVVVRVREKAAGNADYAAARADFEAWEARHGRIPAGAIVVLDTGWAARWGDPPTYVNADARRVMHFPGYSDDAARFLSADRGVAALGIDTFSVDPGASTTFGVHHIFLGAGGYQIENLANVDSLPEAGATLIVAPLPIAGGSGSPARVLAIVP